MSQSKAAKEFSERWKGRGYEKGDSNLYWIDLLTNVLGVKTEEISEFIQFEDQVHLDHTSFIDAYIPSTKVLIEQKSIGKSLNAAIKQSDGSLLSPFQQAKRYIVELPVSKHPRWVITSNFAEIWIYDMEKPGGDPEKIQIADMEKEYYRLRFLVDTKDKHIEKEKQVSLQAGAIVGLLYDAFLKQYKDPENPESLSSLNKLCVRIVFLLYAEDADILGRKGMFHDYLAQFPTKGMRNALIDLFQVLDQKEEDRDPYLDSDLAAFPFVNGGLFSDKNIEIPQFTEEIRDLLLNKASADFNWSEISPTIFGAVFESTLNPETRRAGGMHYTSIENIHKVIDPLFLDGLKEEFQKIILIPAIKTKRQKLGEFQDKLASYHWLDPAAGSGNFLTESYICIRRLENAVISTLYDNQMFLGWSKNPVKVSISQFHGIEINDFAVTVAKTALWISESQMLKETEDIVNDKLEFLPLKTNANIIKENSLHINWEDVVSKKELTWIMGNPPFRGARYMSASQKSDLNNIFKDWKHAGNLDYVSCWYKKAADIMQGTNITTALVSTNSIVQGESVATLWKPLFNSGVHINFAHRTFEWESEAKLKAHVHCVIIGFSTGKEPEKKYIYTSGLPLLADHINAYLLDTPDIFIESRQKPICNVPEIKMGNQPIDDGHYLFSKEEMEEFIEKEPLSKKYFHPWYGSKEFINGNSRYCLYLGNCSPSELRKMPACIKIIEKVRNYRLKSKRQSTLKLADFPTHFQTEVMPKGNYIVIPEVSSEQRRYIPIGYMNDSVLCSNKLRLMPNASLYHFGILNSNVHMAWVRTVCGRLEMRYDYSIKIVYNNFPWPDPTPEQRKKIEQTAQGILDARALYPNTSLADLYDPLLMPKELRKAIIANDYAVTVTYGFVKGTTAYSSEAACVTELLKMYQSLIEKEIVQ